MGKVKVDTTPFRKEKQAQDWTRLISLVSRHIRDLGSGYGSNVELSRKIAAWNYVEKDFNASTKHGQKTRQQLQIMWSNLKVKTRNARSKVGPSAPLKDPLMAATEKVLQKLVKPTLPRKRILRFSETDEYCIDSDVEVYKASSDGYLKEESRPSSSCTTVSVKNCPKPKSQFITIETESNPCGENSSSEEKRTMPTTSDPSHNNAAPLQQGQNVSQHVFQPSSTAADTSTSIVSALPSYQFVQTATNTAVFYPVITGQYPAGTSQQTPAPVTKALDVASTSPQIFFMPTSASSPIMTQYYNAVGSVPHTPIGYTLQSRPGSSSSSSSSSSSTKGTERAEDMHLLLQLRDQQTHIQYALQKSLYDAKINTEELLMKMSDELRVTRMQAHAANCHNELAMLNVLRQQKKECHFTRMRTEKMNINFQRELCDVQTEIAMLENQRAAINKRRVEVELKKVELELLQFESKSASVISRSV